MAGLLPGGIAAPPRRDNDLGIPSQSPFMSSKPRNRIDLEEVEKAIGAICRCPAELIQQLSAPERLVATAVRSRCGVNP